MIVDALIIVIALALMVFGCVILWNQASELYDEWRDDDGR